MKKLTALLVLSGSLFAGEYLIDKSIFTNNGWNQPVVGLTTSTYYDYNSATYKANWGFNHGGVDIKATLGSSVYAIDDGEILHLIKNYDTANTSRVYVKHKSINGDFIVTYGHVMILSSVETNYNNGNKKVTQGMQIGTIKRFGSPDHIHFEIRNSGSDSTIYDAFGSIKGNVVNPIDYLKNNKNDSTSDSSTLISYFDGAGSLVNSKDTCWGCDKDQADMHPHDGAASTVVFQWRYNATSCSQLDITSANTIDAVIRSKKWSGDSIDSAIQVTLEKGKYITIKRPTTNEWTTLAITSLKPISTQNAIRAYCRTPNDSFNAGNRKNVSKDLVALPSGYYWSGTGSIISQATPSSSSYPYGVSKDEAVTLSGKKSFTSFQWDTTSCPTLNITNGSSTDYAKVSVDMKPWNKNDTFWESVCTELPCSVSENIKGYYILKVKDSNSAITNKKIVVECKK